MHRTGKCERSATKDGVRTADLCDAQTRCAGVYTQLARRHAPSGTVRPTCRAVCRSPEALPSASKEADKIKKKNQERNQEQLKMYEKPNKTSERKERKNRSASNEL